jgi:hypothetical protein
MKHTNSSPSSRTIEQVELDHNGNLQQRSCMSNQDRTTQNTLFSFLYPNARLACLNLISESMPFPVEVVEQVSSGAKYNGVTYLPVGSRRSIAQCELYLIEEGVHDAIADRFRACPEALIAHFDILVSPCDLLEVQPDLRVLVIPNDVPGLNDWQGWVRQSAVSRFDLPGSRVLYPFLMSFAGTQAKGEFALMDDPIADRSNADIIISKRCLKPIPRSSSQQFPPYGMFRGEVVLGINESQREELLNAEMILKLLDEHVCRPGCDSTSSPALRDFVARTFPVRKLCEVQQQ